MVFAADVGRPAPVYTKAPIAPVWSWTGLYIGGQVGGGWARTSWDDDFNCAVGVLCDSNKQNPSGVVAGGQIGARWQTGPWVLGIEGTGAWTDIKATDPSTCTKGVNTCIGLPFDVHHTTKIEQLYTGTVSAGYAWNQTLWYAKGGWAGADIVRNTVGFAGATGITSGDVNMWSNGWTVGTGVEYMLTKNFSLGLEYDYARLREGGFQVRTFIIGAGTPAFLNNAGGLDADLHQVLLRANYRLMPQ
jgi:outer membrane immunogenic protein